MTANNAEGGVTGVEAPLGQAKLSRYWRPRHWPYWLLWLWMRLTAALPLRWAVKLHKLVGRLAYRIGSKRAFVVRRNLQICFPELAAAEIEALVERQFESIGASVAETAIAWCAPQRKFAGRFMIEGREHLERALERGRGVILFTGHFTTLEICGRAFKEITPLFTYMYTPRRDRLLDEIQYRGRSRSAHESILSSDVRAMLRSLRRNATVWYAPDEVYLGSNGRLVDFFGVPAMTNIATPKLARLSGAAVLAYFCRRLPDDSGYELKFLPVPDFPGDDAIADTRRLVAMLEDYLRLCPEQYLWLHKRFRNRPAGYPDLYAREPA